MPEGVEYLTRNALSSASIHLATICLQSSSLVLLELRTTALTKILDRESISCRQELFLGTWSRVFEVSDCCNYKGYGPRIGDKGLCRLSIVLHLPAL